MRKTRAKGRQEGGAGGESPSPTIPAQPGRPGLGHGTAAVSQEKGMRLSPVLLWKSGTSLRPKYFLWDVARSRAGRAGMAHPAAPPRGTAPRPAGSEHQTGTAGSGMSSGETWPRNKASVCAPVIPSPGPGSPRTHRGLSFLPERSRRSRGRTGHTPPAPSAAATAGIAQPRGLWATGTGHGQRPAPAVS